MTRLLLTTGGAMTLPAAIALDRSDQIERFLRADALLSILLKHRQSTEEGQQILREPTEWAKFPVATPPDRTAVQGVRVVRIEGAVAAGAGRDAT